jgi:Galactose oxidase, central domain
MWILRVNSQKSSEKLVIMDADKIMASGNPPKPRCAHSATVYTKYIAIFGGKNYGEVSLAYNDLYLFNIGMRLHRE